MHTHGVIRRHAGDRQLIIHQRGVLISASQRDLAQVLPHLKVLPAQPGRANVLLRHIQLAFAKRHPPHRVPRRLQHLGSPAQRADRFIQRPPAALFLQLVERRARRPVGQRQLQSVVCQLIRSIVHHVRVIRLLHQRQQSRVSILLRSRLQLRPAQQQLRALLRRICLGLDRKRPLRHPHGTVHPSIVILERCERHERRRVLRGSLRPALQRSPPHRSSGLLPSAPQTPPGTTCTSDGCSFSSFSKSRIAARNLAALQLHVAINRPTTPAASV